VAGSGQLERAVLHVLWAAPEPLAARSVLAALNIQSPAQQPGAQQRELAITTVLTVLDRLGRKGLVRRERGTQDGSRPAFLYQTAVSREDYIAGLMLEALGQAPDRGAALTRFLGSVTATDTDHLRRALDPPGPGG
jgi:predicted transcriptional regulator